MRQVNFEALSKCNSNKCSERGSFMWRSMWSPTGRTEMRGGVLAENRIQMYFQKAALGSASELPPVKVWTLMPTRRNRMGTPWPQEFDCKSGSSCPQLCVLDGTWVVAEKESQTFVTAKSLLCFEIFLLVEEKLITCWKYCTSLKCSHVTVKGGQGEETFNPQLAEFIRLDCWSHWRHFW